eukprot:TRINITY_DN10414_c0_g1_i1.p1 TRINITY_DN10414_c0_g1~~TRINITY_DN10414_c0_g1_i1.p1  ORF type:complete len:214 (+),score=30.47 TRINITY_DN10414_c0_g1_i1:34-675(+)
MTETDVSKLISTLNNPASNHFSKLSLPVAPVDAKALKKQFKRLALLVHPDKCDDPKATDAFKQLNLSFEYLTDAGKQADLLHSLQPPKEKPRPPEHYKFHIPKTAEEIFRRRKEDAAKKHEEEKEREQRREPPLKRKEYPFDYTEINKKTKTDKASQDRSSYGFSCTICKRTFPNEHTLKRHTMFGGFNHKFNNRTKSPEASRPSHIIFEEET